MVGPEMLPDGVTGPIDRARLRNERFIAELAVATAIIGIGIVSWRIATVEAAAGYRILAVAVLAALVFVASRLDPRPLVPWKLWARCTIEVTCASTVLVMDATVSPAHLASSSTPYIYPLAIAMTCLRLRPALCAYSAGMSIVQQLAVYLYAFHGLDELEISGSVTPMPRLYQELSFRLLLLALVGVLGWVLARTLAKEIAASAKEEAVRAAFGSYVDRRVVERVLRGDLKVAPERRRVTVMFIDIRGFTTFSETREPEEVYATLSATLDMFASEVQRQGGIVNKFLGDGLMAIFGAPESQPDHARRAVRAALFIRDEARRRAAKQFPGLRIGIGIHTGSVVVGDLGSARREYTAIGDVVNVASRVEAANKDLKTTILATDAVIEALGSEASVRPQPPLPLRGRAGAVPLFEVLDMEVLGDLSKVM
jgi:adenylate cyclase